MSDAIAGAMSNAAQSLRDTAKWLVGGVAATAAGVFAGSSLTSLGSLDPAKDILRLAGAGGGFVLGLGALAMIFGAAVRVLTRESMTLAQVATSQDTEVTELRSKLEARYKTRLIPVGGTLAGYVEAVQEALKNPTKEGNVEIIRRAERDNALIAADAAFHLVRARFDALVSRLKVWTVLAIVGFGVFAWAANPPKASPAPFAACPPTMPPQGFATR